MRFILNVLWAIFGGGLILALEYLVAGLLCFVSIIGIPFGAQCFKLAGLALFPFGKDLSERGASGLTRGVFNVVWLVVAGLWIFLSHIALALSLAVTIIGIPFAIQHVKLAMLALWPFGAEIRERR